MTWKNHKLVTIAMAYTVDLPLEGIVVATLASVFPDAIELLLHLRHRGVSHFWIIYVIMFLIAHFGFADASVSACLAEWFALGCLFHLFQDAMSKSGIELYPGSRNKIKLGQLYITHQASEYITALVIIALCLGIKALRVTSGSSVWKPGLAFFGI